MLCDPPWYKVAHPWFDPGSAYKPIAYTLASESAWAYLTFVLASGHTVAVQNKRCTALPLTCEARHIDQRGHVRPLTETEAMFPGAGKLTPPNPDLDLDMQ